MLVRGTTLRHATGCCHQHRRPLPLVAPVVGWTSGRTGSVTLAVGDPPDLLDRHSTRVADPEMVFVAQRANLVRQATRILGSASDAEDVVQEVWLRWRRHHTTVESAPCWLSTVTRNLALDGLRHRNSRREVGLGLDLEIKAAAVLEAGFARAEGMASLSNSFRVVLASLSGLERVVFVLREALDWPHADIARLIGRTDAAVRQLQHRAARHVAAAPNRFDVTTIALGEVSQAFADLDTGGDVVTFLKLLAPDVAPMQPWMCDVNGQEVHEAVGILLVTGERRLLLCHRRPDLSWHPDVWDVARSQLLNGEPLAACAMRTARHKLRVSVVEPTPVGQINDDTLRISMFCALQWEGTPRGPRGAQHDALKFFTRKEVSHLALADPRYLTLFDQVT